MARSTSLLALAPLALTAACSSVDPAVDAAPPAVVMHPEAGYLDVPAQSLGAVDAARMFYSFHPADAHPELAPLLVFFNGGPGSATTSVLLPFGTGPKTLSADDIGAGPADNPASFTRFANLLYLDERDAGFSYELAEACAGTSNYVTDAGDFVLALLAFLDGHAPLVKSHVVLVGESYGGTRAPVMLELLQGYADVGAIPASPGAAGMASQVPWLQDRMQAHLDLAFPERAGQRWTPAQVAEQLGWEVLIQPSFMGIAQMMLQQPAEARDPILAAAAARQPPANTYDVRMSAAEYQARATLTSHVMREPAALEALLGVPLESVDGLAAAQRGTAVRDVDPASLASIVADEAALRARLGKLGPSDAYFLAQVTPHCGDYLGDVGSADMLVDGLSRTQAFITNARYDAVVYSPEIPVIFALGSSPVTVDTKAPAGAARPGVIRIAPADAPPISIRFPGYEAGHEVTMSAGAELAADVEVWLTDTGAIQP